jgi:hypothetical protein
VQKATTESTQLAENIQKVEETHTKANSGEPEDTETIKPEMVEEVHV